MRTRMKCLSFSPCLGSGIKVLVFWPRVYYPVCHVHTMTGYVSYSHKLFVRSCGLGFLFHISRYVLLYI
ncbi:hypothetical protein EDB83DRAFT_2336864 [Lactarius deliciosus]|nr:hypothetical protein EDB83DRAFT_2336864 [Lactarius deliciosus]